MDVSGIVKQKSKTQIKKEAARLYNEIYEQKRLDALIKNTPEQIIQNAVDVGVFKEAAETIVEQKEIPEQEQPKLSPAEFAKQMGWNKIPKFKINAQTYNIRKMFGQLTKSELYYDAVKRPKVERGMEKIYRLLARAGV